MVECSGAVGERRRSGGRLVGATLAEKLALPGSQARAIRQISEGEGSFITRIDLLMALVG